eukprot:816344-Pleurochrysis_carterae.AAC.1
MVRLNKRSSDRRNGDEKLSESESSLSDSTESSVMTKSCQRNSIRERESRKRTHLDKARNHDASSWLHLETELNAEEPWLQRSWDENGGQED